MTTYPFDVQMVDLTTDSEDTPVYSSVNEVDPVINISTDSDSDDDNIPWYNIQDCFEPRVGMADTAPWSKNYDQGTEDRP